jgi:uncharacterized protein (DUF885 family)
LNEIGFLQSRLFRVARMLIDLGIHASGWSREQAITELMRMTAQSRAPCELDVDRYFVLPSMIAGDEISYYACAEGARRRCTAPHRSMILHPFTTKV